MAISSFDWGLHNLTELYVEEEKKKLVASGFSRSIIETIISFEIVTNTLLPDFLKREFSTNDLGVILKKFDDPYFYHLADLIWQLKDMPSFKKYILSGARTKTKECVYSELYFLNMISRVSEYVDFNFPIGKKGNDFDLIATNFRSHSNLLYSNLNIEVKTRSSPFKNKEQIKDYLNKARKQLPSSSDGAICILLEENFLPSTINQKDLDSTFKQYLETTKRISFLVYLWIEKTSIQNNKRALVIKYKCLNKDGEINLFDNVLVLADRPFMIIQTKMTTLT